MREVIARSQDKRRMAGTYLLMLGIGIALIVLGVILLGAEGDAWWGYVLIPVGALACVAAALYLVTVLRQPAVVAVRDGDTLIFLGKRIAFSEIRSIEYSVPNGNTGATWGNLRIWLKNGGKVQCRFVADVSQAVVRMEALRKEYESGTEVL